MKNENPKNQRTISPIQNKNGNENLFADLENMMLQSIGNTPLYKL